MKKDKGTPNTSDTESQSFKQHYAGSNIAKSHQVQKQAVRSKNETNNHKRETIPPELDAMMKWLRDPSNHNAITAVFTALIFLATSGYAVVALYQLWSIRDATEISKGQLSVLQVQQRAWVKVDITSPEFKLEDVVGIGFPLYMENVGNTPAIHIFAKSVAEIVEKDKSPACDYTGQFVGTWRGILFPKDRDYFAATQFGPNNLPRPLTSAERKEVMEGNKYFAFCAYVTYDDAFGSYWTQYCGKRAFGPRGSTINALPCVAYNQAGKTEK
jgi:hypothetical protein